MNNFTLSLQSGLIAVYIIIALAALALSWWSYRNLVPQISSLKRGFLITLRTLGIFLLALLLIEPLLTKYSEKTTGNKLGLALDLSSSMQIDDDGVSRYESLAEAVGNISQSQSNIEYFGFSDTLIELDGLPDSSKFSGRATDLGLALTKPVDLATDQLGALLIITDGAGNIGADPLAVAMKSDIPVYSLVVGKAISFNDIAITKVDFPPVSYINTEITVGVEVKSSGYEGRAVLVEISDKGKVISSKKVSLPSDGAHINIEFPLTLTEEGAHTLKAAISGFEDEAYGDNNSRSFSLKLLKDKTKILCISGALNWEYTFIQRAFSADPHFELKTAMAGSNRTIAARELPVNLDLWKEYDLIIALDTPSGAIASQINNLKAAVESGTGFLYIAGNESRGERLGGWDEILPVKATGHTSLKTGEFFPTPGHQAIVKTITDIENLDWNSLSPIEYLYDNLALENNAIVFLDVVENDRDHYPVLTGGFYKNGKTAAITGYPWWKRSFRQNGGTQLDDGIARFWGNLVRWLVAREDLDKFNLVSDKAVYRLGEPVAFDATLFDDSYNLLSGARIILNIADSAGVSREFNLSATEAGRYSGVYGSPSAGKYKFTGYAVAENDTIGIARGEFFVETFGLEMENPSANYSIMSQIASLTGAKSYTIDNFANFQNDLILKTGIEDIFQEYRLTGNTFILIILILLFALEWGIRKFSQLA